MSSRDTVNFPFNVFDIVNEIVTVQPISMGVLLQREYLEVTTVAESSTLPSFQWSNLTVQSAKKRAN